MALEKLDDGTKSSGIQLQMLHIRQLQSNDSGIYECETLGAIRQYNLTITGENSMFSLTTTEVFLLGEYLLVH